PVQLATVDIGAIRDIHAVDNLLYVAAEETGLHVFDISDPTAPRERVAGSIPGDARGVAVGDGYAYLAAGGAGFQVFSLTAAADPVIAGWTETYGRAIDGTGRYLYLAAEQNGLQVIDVTTPTSPQQVETVATFGAAVDLSRNDAYLYLADEIGGLLRSEERRVGKVGGGGSAPHS